MKKLKLVSTVILIAVFCLLITSAVSAANDGLVTPTAAAGTAAGDETDLLETATNWILGITGAVAVIFIIFGGFRYITASGNTEQMTKAKEILIKAIIGLVIVVVAYVIVTAIVGALGT
ncbi:hypothetical protein ACFL2B_01820 [Patescibacteria group bacterium]